MITIPTQQDLYTRYLSNLETAYGDSIPTFGKVFLRAAATAQAGVMRLFYLAIGKLQKNIFVDTADQEELVRWGVIKLGRTMFTASAGQYIIQVSGLVGAVVPAQTTFKSDDDSINPGKIFILDNLFTLVATTGLITVRALEVGLDSKMAITETMTATAPIVNVDKAATVTAESVAPLAAEDIEDYRAKIVLSFRSEPQGGAGADYRNWAFDAAGVKQTYPYARPAQAGHVDLYVEANIVDSTDGKGTPSGFLLSAVEAVVEMDPDTSKPILERGRRPLGVLQVHYNPIVPLNVDIQIPGFVGLTAQIQTDLFNALKLVLTDIRPFVASVDLITSKNDIISTNIIINTILSTYPGSIFATPILTVNGVVQSSHTFIAGDIPYLNSVTYP